MIDLHTYALILKVVGIIAGLIFMFFGYKLFMKGIKPDDAEISGSISTYKISISRAAPGTILAILGAIIVGISILKPITKTKETQTGITGESVKDVAATSDSNAHKTDTVVEKIEKEKETLAKQPGKKGHIPNAQPQIKPEILTTVEKETLEIQPKEKKFDPIVDKNRILKKALALNMRGDNFSAYTYFMLALKLQELSGDSEDWLQKYKTEINNCESDSKSAIGKKVYMKIHLINGKTDSIYVYRPEPIH